MKVCFVSHHFADPEALLKTIVKMTPGRSGKWKDMEAVLDPFEADFVILVDGHSHIKIPEKRALYFNQHPKGVGAYKTLADKPFALATYPADNNLNLGEWWISYDYDFLSTLQPPTKSKNLISITTYHIERNKPTYQHRIAFLEEYVQLSKDIDIYGRQEDRFRANPIFKDTYRGVAGYGVNCDYRAGEHIIGKDIEIDYRYALDFDHGRMGDGLPVKHYFSERFYDSMLLWTMPLYFGSDNADVYLPKHSFRYVNIVPNGVITLKSEVQKAIDIVNSDFREKHLSDMAEARHLLLNKYQLWPYVYEAIKRL